MIFVLITNKKPGQAKVSDVKATVMTEEETAVFLLQEGIDDPPPHWNVGKMIWINSDILVRVE